MFQLIGMLPPFSVGVKASGEVTKNDFKDILLPALHKAAKEYKAINFLMVLETDMKNFTAGAWMMDAKVNLMYFFKWNKIAMVSCNKTMEDISGVSDIFIPGEVKTFPVNHIDEAKEWISHP